MFQNAVVDVAIGLIVMYLTLALLSTVVNEFIATKLKLRANSLTSAIAQLIDNDQLRHVFYNHGLIVGTRKTVTTGSQSTLAAAKNIASAAANRVMTVFGGTAAARASTTSVTVSAPHQDHPSYLSSRTFALALIGSLDTGKPIPVFKDVETAVTTLPVCKLRDALLSSLTEAQGDLNTLRSSIATWFDDTMDRLSGAYKRQLKWISMIVGFVIAIAFNADSVKVATTLWNDPVRRAATIERASTFAKTTQPQGDQAVDLNQLRGNVATTEQTLRFLPIGWRCDTDSSRWVWDEECRKTSPRSDSEKLLQLLGWILTGAALTLGAPFWFDVLGKFVNLRGAGAKPPREDEKGS